jgi:valyl-tRNA synthetase
MEIPKAYDPSTTEDKWYKHWMDNGFFKSTPDDRESYTIVIPPPNVTGVLHMGHMLNNTIQDVLVRRARMLGYNACWVPGTDHASIATEAKVVSKLKEEGIDKHDLSREEFLDHAWAWTRKHGGIILSQLQKLGASCDWDRTSFTLDEGYYDDVVNVFIDQFNKGLIYRGVRMINWDPAALTALSDEEVVYEGVNSKLYYVRYRVEGGDDEWLTIATTRPETILGDTAICINPNDDRYKHLKGKSAIVPIANRTVPIIFDEYVDIEFGTGCLKITPAHDLNDYELGIKYNLETIDILNPDGTLSEAAGHYIGEDRFDVRKKIAKELEEHGYLVKTEDHLNKVGYSERTHAAIEPRLSLQWFCKMDNLSTPALENVLNDEVQFHPPHFKNSYRHWMENIKDWCVSRQLWWGHRIPAYYYGTAANDYVVAKSIEDALEMAKEKSGKSDLTLADMRQDEDVMDTWFSSWLWPISVFNGMKEPDNEEINYYYPTNDLVTAPEIMFFWVARMIMAGYEYQGKLPFKNVYYTGIVRDKLGRKMSKSLGNSPDPLMLIDKYGADAVRSGMLFSSPAGNDLLYKNELIEQGAGFSNKIWNAFRLIKMWSVMDIDQPESSAIAIDWFRSKLNEALAKLNEHYDSFRMSDALMTTYKLIYDEFCGRFLEIIKPGYEQPIDRKTYDAAIVLLEDVLRLVHPLMPFITEDIWQRLADRKTEESIMLAEWPKGGEVNEELMHNFELAYEAIIGIRNVRQTKNIAMKVELALSVKENEKFDRALDTVIQKVGNLTKLDYVSEKVDNAFSFMVKSNEYFIPMGDAVNVADEIKKLTEELEYTKGFLASVDKKLNNERFVSSAPEKVVTIEKTKQADALSKIKVLEEKLASMN